jgi:hypothetical protein
MAIVEGAKPTRRLPFNCGARQVMIPQLEDNDDIIEDFNNSNKQHDKHHHNPVAVVPPPRFLLPEVTVELRR